MEDLLKSMKMTLEADQKLVDEYGTDSIGTYYNGAVSRDLYFIDMLQKRIDAEKWVNKTTKQIAEAE